MSFVVSLCSFFPDPKIVGVSMTNDFTFALNVKGKGTILLHCTLYPTGRSTMQKAIDDRYPRVYQLEDSARVNFSLMSLEDQDALSKFIAKLPQRDLSYLQVDITQPEAQARWLRNIEEGKSICICAYDSKGMVGYASVQISEDKERRVGEIRVNIVQGYRSRGLGRGLIDEVMFISRQIELETVTARMLSDQFGAQSAFKRLGFHVDRLLESYVEESPGASKDLLVMSTTLH